MKANPILRELRKTRDDLAREAGYDLQRLFDLVHAREGAAVARGIPVVRPAASAARPATEIVREEPS